jgi:hypothetical protein
MVRCGAPRPSRAGHGADPLARRALIYISEALAGELIGLVVLPSGDHIARFATIDLGVISRGTSDFTRFGAARPGRVQSRRAGEPGGGDAATHPVRSVNDDQTP